MIDVDLDRHERRSLEPGRRARLRRIGPGRWRRPASAILSSKSPPDDPSTERTSTIARIAAASTTNSVRSSTRLPRSHGLECGRPVDHGSPDHDRATPAVSHAAHHQPISGPRSRVSASPRSPPLAFHELPHRLERLHEVRERHEPPADRPPGREPQPGHARRDEVGLSRDAARRARRSRSTTQGQELDDPRQPRHDASDRVTSSSDTNSSAGRSAASRPLLTESEHDHDRARAGH